MIVRLRLFAAARQAAGLGSDSFELAKNATLRDLVARARERYGEGFSDVLSTARVWVNGDEPAAGAATVLAAGDEVAVLPPVSGGGLP